MPRAFHPLAFAVVLAVLVLAGCAAPVVRPPLPASTEGIEEFALDGRIAVKLDTRGYSANLKWRHQAQSDALRLLSPLGTTIAQVEADADGATLVGSDKKVYRSQNVEALTREVLGWDLPLKGLQHWVLGRPDPELPVAEAQRDARDRWTQFTQNGWEVAYQAFTEDGPLPQRMTLAREGLRLRLLVDRWEIGG